jgi:hypothetical protein
VGIICFERFGIFYLMGHYHLKIYVPVSTALIIFAISRIFIRPSRLVTSAHVHKIRPHVETIILGHLTQELLTATLP